MPKTLHMPPLIIGLPVCCALIFSAALLYLSNYIHERFVLRNKIVQVLVEAAFYQTAINHYYQNKHQLPPASETNWQLLGFTQQALERNQLGAIGQISFSPCNGDITIRLQYKIDSSPAIDETASLSNAAGRSILLRPQIINRHEIRWLCGPLPSNPVPLEDLPLSCRYNWSISNFANSCNV